MLSHVSNYSAPRPRYTIVFRTLQHHYSYWKRSHESLEIKAAAGEIVHHRFKDGTRYFFNFFLFISVHIRVTARGRSASASTDFWSNLLVVRTLTWVKMATVVRCWWHHLHADVSTFCLCFSSSRCSSRDCTEVCVIKWIPFFNGLTEKSNFTSHFMQYWAVI